MMRKIIANKIRFSGNKKCYSNNSRLTFCAFYAILIKILQGGNTNEMYAYA